MRRSRYSNGPRGLFLFLILVLFVSIGSILACIDPLFLILCGLAIGLICLFRIVENREKKKENWAIVNTPEKPFTPIPISEYNNFSCEEEKFVNLAFREYLQQYNEIHALKSHIMSLEEKINALRALHEDSRASTLTAEMEEATEKFSVLQRSGNPTFESQLNAAFFHTTEMQAAYSPFASHLPNKRMPFIGDFFQSPYIKIVQTSDDNALVFLPCYLLSYSKPDDNLQLIKYDQVSVSAEISTERLGVNQRAHSTDEIEHISYLHETKDGSRDLRYSYENNPSFVYVYRGKVTIQYETFSYTQNFSNKTSAKKFEEAFKQYQNLINSKYSAVVKLLLNHSARISSSENLAEMIEQQNAAEQKRLQKLEQQREKRAELRQQKLAEQAAAKKEREREKEFLKNFIISRETLLGWRGNEKNLVIPEGLFTKVGAAFRENRTLRSIVLPSGTTEISPAAFCNAAFLRKVELPASIQKIGSEAFSGCTALSSLTLPPDIKVIPSGLFANCSSLKRCTLPASVVKIEDGAFSGCYSLVEINLPNELTAIGDNAFANCIQLKEIVFPQSLQTLGENAFSGCISLEKVDGIEQVAWHKKRCFAGAPWLASQAVDDFVVWEDYLEAYTGTQAEVHVPSGIASIGASAFEGNDSIMTVWIPEGVVSIGERAFANCKKLQIVQIPDSVRQIADNAFSAASNVVIQCTRGSIASAFRIRNKLPGEYISKSPPMSREKFVRKEQAVRGSGSSIKLTNEELGAVMELRRQKIAQKKAQSEQHPPLEVVEFELATVDSSKMAIRLLPDKQKITNNIFTLQFGWPENTDADLEAADYETFVVDAHGHTISDVKQFHADPDDKQSIYKVTISLSTKAEFDKSADYYVILRYQGADRMVLSKTRYQIAIDFVSDFDF